MAARKYDYTTYVHGSTAKETESGSAHDEEQRRHREQGPAKRKKRRRAKATEWDLASLVFMLAAVAAAMGICVSYIQVQHNITTMSKKIAAAESEVAQLREENDTAYNAVDSSVDLAEVYKTAVKKLGMVPITNDQIYTYQGKKSSFVRQYGEVPEEEGNFLDKLIDTYRSK